MDNNAFPLTRLQTGESAILLNMQCGRCMASRLSSLGLTPGVELTMTQNYHHGPLLVMVRGSKVALGRHEAARMLVQKKKV